MFKIKELEKIKAKENIEKQIDMIEKHLNKAWQLITEFRSKDFEENVVEFIEYLSEDLEIARSAKEGIWNQIVPFVKFDAED